MHLTAKTMRRLSISIIVLSSTLGTIYLIVSLIGATLLVAQKPAPITHTPEESGLQYTNVSFPSSDDHVQLRGWIIPGVLPDGQLTLHRILIVLHGAYANRTDSNVNLLSLQVALAQKGFAILAFDMRGEGESDPAPFSLGYFEQRDVLGAVDFLQHGNLPYLELGRPQVIGGLGISMGGGSMLLAAAHEPAIKAIVADSASADAAPVLERHIPQDSHVPAFFTPGVLTAAQAIFGIDFRAIRPVDIVVSLAPRPLFFIAGAQDDFVGIQQFPQLVDAARSAPNAQVSAWLVPGAKHAQSYNHEGEGYVNRVVDFFDANLGLDPAE